MRVGPGVRLPRLPALHVCGSASGVSHPKQIPWITRRWTLWTKGAGDGTMPPLRGCQRRLWRFSLTRPVEVKCLSSRKNKQELSSLTSRLRRWVPRGRTSPMGLSPPECCLMGQTVSRSTNALACAIKKWDRSQLTSNGLMREKVGGGLPTFALTADVKEAHRQIPVAACDWHFRGCQVTPSEEVYVNTVGTFGVASASYYRTGSSLPVPRRRL